MKLVYDDPVTGIILGIGACIEGISTYMKPDSAMGTGSLVICAITLGLFIFRLIRTWKNCEYTPPARLLPILQLINALLWFAVVIIWWDKANSSDGFIGIGLMIILMISAAKDMYEAVKMFIKAHNR